MKRILLSMFTITSLMASAQIVNIPDANFKAYLVGNSTINTNADAEIQESEASAFSGQINCGTMGIEDLTGIEAFTSLTDLRCHSNQLSTLDVSQNTSLTILGCAYNSISSLNLSSNTALTILNFDGNDITTMDLSSLSELNSLKCRGNLLTSLNVANGNNVNFVRFMASNNPDLTCIEVDDITFSTTNWMDKDITANFNTNCNGNVGVNEITQNLEFITFPNPTTGEITFSTTEQISKIEIFNLQGQQLATFIDVNTIDISDFTSGVFMAKISTNQKVGVVNLVKE